jgi:hypothetical protein
MALMIFVGTSGQAIASLICDMDACAKASKPAPVEKKSCCPDSEGAPSSDEPGNCCCELDSIPVTTAESVKLSIAEPLTIDALPAPITVQLVVRIPQEQILSRSDSSPPHRPIVRVLGRAPPVA